MTARRALLPALVAAVLAVGGCVAVEVPVSGPGTEATPGAGATASPAPETSVDASPAEEEMARAILERVDAERVERGLAPVEWDEDLAAVARAWSAEMAERDQLAHQDIRALLQRDRLSGFQGLGENVFRATGPVPAGTIHAGWMRSDDHRVNVLNPGWDRLGVGVHCAPDGSVWATQEFGRTAGADRPAVETGTPPQEPVARPADDGPTCG
ncbi:CAP domain-containing protein [Geodermatophilus marinus]|uniref:CAP domain-containing protein n=1 Tax=Geodermatophilus sp. LHW52908 TaxID=2303986 RepID=UPI001F381483|nr:CAP domain-containing protein [Geodermatophilus sp. LHW52908]